MTGPTRRAKLCLKARPTERQLADRLRPLDYAFPDGLELYLDAADLADRSTMDAVIERLQAYALPPDFALLIEGPVGSLDGEFFDVTRQSEADRQVVDHLAALAGRIGAKAVNVHVIAPSDDLGRLTLDCRADLLALSVPFLQHFVEVTRAAGAAPTVENMPLVLRMRQGGFFFTPIGMASEDLRWLVEQVPGLLLLGDTSHAGLYLNGRRAAAGDLAPTAEEASQPWLEPLLAYVRQLPTEAPDVLGYFQSLAPSLVNAQVSNAAGLLGEGLPYAHGDVDLDPVITWLGSAADHVVTETLEPDQDDAGHMRDALRHMRAVLA